MDDVHCIPFRETGYFSALICDYLDQKEDVKDFYHRFPSLENFENQLKEKENFSPENRQILSRVLQQQYAAIRNPKISIENSLRNIRLLEGRKTFTVTTGHQLSLFTGPLYFIYKIVSAINLSKQLSSKYPDYHFVPVYWMASEDHDFAEINHIHLHGGRISWEQDRGGPVGRLNTESLKPVLDELEKILGPSTHAESLLEVLRNAYLEHTNLAEATRAFVHHIFGHEGLVIMDADDAELKRLAAPYFEKDLIQHLPQQKVDNTSEALAQKYFNQIHAREINLFYIKDGLRERIEQDGEHWKVLNTDISWNEDELRQSLAQEPEAFSPNVVLRPLYQEIILPNLAYIGGGGELAYWFQLKGMFKAFNVPFPMLMLRNSVLGLSGRQERKMNKLELSVDQFFKPIHHLQNELAAESAPIDPEMDEYHQLLEKMFNDLETVAKLTDKSMLGAVNAQRQKQLNGLENLKKKLLRAEKRKNHELMDRVETLRGEVFPNNSLQERYDNCLPYLVEYGANWITTLLNRLNPLDYRFVVMNWETERNAS